MELFAKTVNGFQLLTDFAKNSILDVYLGSEYAPVNFLRLKEQVFFYPFLPSPNNPIKTKKRPNMDQKNPYLDTFAMPNKVF